MDHLVALSTLSPQEKGVVRALQGGRGFVGRMVALGFTPGATVTMVQNFGRGPMIVLVRGTRVALGRGEGQKVLVQRAEDGHAENR